jgi:hypothetical protein
MGCTLSVERPHPKCPAPKVEKVFNMRVQYDGCLETTAEPGLVRILVLGPRGSGKTTMVHRITTGEAYHSLGGHDLLIHSKMRVQTNYGEIPLLVVEVPPDSKVLPIEIAKAAAVIVIAGIDALETEQGFGDMECYMSAARHVPSCMCANKIDAYLPSVQLRKKLQAFRGKVFSTSYRSCFNFEAPLLHLLRLLSGHPDLRLCTYITASSVKCLGVDDY